MTRSRVRTVSLVVQTMVTFSLILSISSHTMLADGSFSEYSSDAHKGGQGMADAVLSPLKPGASPRR